MDQEQNNQERQRLLSELKNLRDFLNSPGYLAGKRIVDEGLSSATTLIFELPPDDPAYHAKIMQAVGEGRAYRKWNSLYSDRIEEIQQELGELTLEERQSL